MERKGCKRFAITTEAEIKFLPVAIFKMATTIPQKFNIVRFQMCTAHVLMRFCHQDDRSFVCKAKEGSHVRMFDLFWILVY